MNKIVDRIRKLLALAQNNDSAAEREAALSKAHAMLLEHNLTAADLGTEEVSTPVGDTVQNFRYSATNPWTRVVCNAVAELYFCRFYYTMNEGRKLQAHFVGTETDGAVAAAIAGMVLDSISRELNAFLRAHKDYPNKSRLITDFTNGAATAIHWRCDALKTKPPAAVAGTALVLYNDKFEAADGWIEKNINLSTRKTKGMSDARTRAVHAGAIVGDRIQLTMSVDGEKQKALQN